MILCFRYFSMRLAKLKYVLPLRASSCALAQLFTIQKYEKINFFSKRGSLCYIDFMLQNYNYAILNNKPALLRLPRNFLLYTDTKKTAKFASECGYSFYALSLINYEKDKSLARPLHTGLLIYTERFS
jgi:hypothetical protein